MAFVDPKVWPEIYKEQQETIALCRNQEVGHHEAFRRLVNQEKTSYFAIKALIRDASELLFFDEKIELFRAILNSNKSRTYTSYSFHQFIEGLPPSEKKVFAETVAEEKINWTCIFRHTDNFEFLTIPLLEKIHGHLKRRQTWVRISKQRFNPEELIKIGLISKILWYIHWNSNRGILPISVLEYVIVNSKPFPFFQYTIKFSLQEGLEELYMRNYQALCHRGISFWKKIIRADCLSDEFIAFLQMNGHG